MEPLGLRKHEALAFQWTDLNLDDGMVTVRRTIARVGGVLVVNPPKTPAGHRTLSLDSGLVDLLRRQRKTQAEDRLRAGSTWQDGGWVFTGPTGNPLDGSNFLRAVKKAGKAVGLPLTNVHMLRHSAATIMLRSNPVKDVSDILGHANAAITLQVYAHSEGDHGGAALSTLAAALDG